MAQLPILIPARVCNWRPSFHSLISSYGTVSKNIITRAQNQHKKPYEQPQPQPQQGTILSTILLVALSLSLSMIDDGIEARYHRQSDASSAVATGRLTSFSSIHKSCCPHLCNIGEGVAWFGRVIDKDHAARRPWYFDHESTSRRTLR